MALGNAKTNTNSTVWLKDELTVKNRLGKVAIYYEGANVAGNLAVLADGFIL